MGRRDVESGRISPSFFSFAPFLPFTHYDHDGRGLLPSPTELNQTNHSAQRSRMASPPP
jgi:hypothetical protein